jgi:hypothetical protein
VPHAFGRYGLIFGMAYFFVRVLHVGCYAAIARACDDRVLLSVVCDSGPRSLLPRHCWWSRAR